jgi:hypothetical protein
MKPATDGVTWLVAALVILAVLLSGAVAWLGIQLDQAEQLTTWPQVCQVSHPEDLHR